MRFALAPPSTLDTFSALVTRHSFPLLLPCHRAAQTFFGRDHVIGVILAEIDLHPVNLAAEDAAVAVVIGSYRRAGLAADVSCLVGREDHRHGALDAALADFLAVVVKRDIAALG